MANPRFVLKEDGTQIYNLLVGIYPVGLMKQIQIGAMGLAWKPGAIMDDKWDSRHLSWEVTGLEEARELGRRVVICSKVVKFGLESFDPSKYDEELGVNRGKIPELKEACKKMKEIEKTLGIEYIQKDERLNIV